MRPASGVKGAALMASRRCAITSAERPWGSRKKVSGSSGARVAPLCGWASCASHQTGACLGPATSGAPGGKSFSGCARSRWVSRPVSPPTRRRCATRGARARLVGRCGVRGCSRSRWGPSHARWSAASVGASLAAGGKRFARARPGQGLDGQEDEEVVLAPGKDPGPLVACEADGERFPGAPLAPGTPPCLKGFWRVLADDVCSCGGARCLSAHLRCGIRPVEAATGRPYFGRFWLHECSPKVWYRGGQGQASWCAAQA